MITITFASLELAGAPFSPVTRYTVIDGGFPLDYDGNTYLNDGLVVALDKTVISAELANVTQNLTLFLDNDVKNAIQEDTYRNRRAKIFKGEWDPTTSALTSVRVIYEGMLDTHNTPNEDGTVEFIISSLISPLRRPSDNIALSVIHQRRLNEGVYGNSNIGQTDNFLKNSGSSFQDFTLGASEYREAVTKPMYIKIKKNMFGNHKRKKVGDEIITPEVQETPGSQLEQPGSYQPARVYGVSGVDAAIVAAWNHDPASNFATTRANYPTDWRGFQDEEATYAVNPDTRFGTIVYLVHAGAVDQLNIYIDGLNGEVQSRTLSLNSGNSGVHYLKDKYENENEVEQNDTYAAVEVLWGTNNQVPPQNWINTSNGEIDTNFRGIGYVLVGITYEATRDGAVARGMPEVGFQVKQTKSISLDVPNWQETFIASQTGLSVDATSPYSTNSFYVDNFLFNLFLSNVRELSSGQTFKSAFSNSFLKIRPSTSFASDLDSAYGLSNQTLSKYNFLEGLLDIKIVQGSTYGQFRVNSISRDSNGTDYSFWLGGDKGYSGTIDPSSTFDIFIEETTRSGDITSLTTRSENQHPARVLIDYLLDKQVGPGLSESEIDLESFLLCQENAAKIPQYINGVIQGETNFVDYIEAIANTANLTIFQEGDKIKCRFRKIIDPDNVAITFTEDNCSDMNLINFRNEDKFNEFILTVDEQKLSNKAAPKVGTTAVESRDSGFLAQDNGIRSIGEFSSDWLTLFYVEAVDTNGDTTVEVDEVNNSEYKASYQQYARFLMDISRFYEEIELTTTYDLAKDFTIGTVFDVENELYGFTGNNIRRYEVVDYADNHDGTISLVGQRHSNAIFGVEDDFSNNEFDTEEPLILPYTSIAQTSIPGSPTLSAVWEPESRRIDLSWTEPTNEFNVTHYQVQEQANSETEWTTISEQLVTSDRVFSRAIVERGGVYKYRVRALTPSGMRNSAFSSVRYVRLDLAFGDNKPEEQRIQITGTRSNASQSGASATVVRVGLPNNFEAAPTDTTGNGAANDIAGLGVNLTRVSDFESAATDSDSGNATVSLTALPGTPSGGTYSVTSNYQPEVVGTASATDATVTAYTYQLTNSAGTLEVDSDYSPATTGRFPATGTSTSAVTNQALSNGAGTITVESDFVAGQDSYDSGEVTHTMATLTDIGTHTGSTSGDGTYSNIGGTTIDLTVDTNTAAATSTAGSGSYPRTVTQTGTDSLTARTVVVGGQQAVLGTLDLSGSITTSSDPFFPGGSGTFGTYTGSYFSIYQILTFASGNINVTNPTHFSSGDVCRITFDDGTTTQEVYSTFGKFSRTFLSTTYYWGFQSLPTLSSSTTYDIDIYENAVAPNLSITSQTANNGYSDNAASVNASTGMVTFPSQEKVDYSISDIPSGADIDLVIDTETLTESGTSVTFQDTNASRSWTLTGGIPTSLGTQTGSTSGAGTYSNLGGSTIDLTVTGHTATGATVPAGGSYPKTTIQTGSDGTDARTVVINKTTTPSVSTTVNNGDTFSVSYTTVTVGLPIVDTARAYVIRNSRLFELAQGTDISSNAVNGTFYVRFNGVQYGPLQYSGSSGVSTTSTTWAGGSTTITLPAFDTYSISSQSSGTDWSDNAATINSSTGAVTLADQYKSEFELSDIPTGADIDFVIGGQTLTESTTSHNFPDSNLSRSWELTGTVPPNSGGTNSPTNIGGFGTGSSDGLNLVQSGSNYVITNNYSKTIPKVVVNVGGVTSTYTGLSSGSSVTVAIPTSGNAWSVTASKPAGTYTLPNGAGTLTITEDSNGIASYVLARTQDGSGNDIFSEGDLFVDGLPVSDTFNNSNTIRPWSVDLGEPDSGSTVYTLTRSALFDQEVGISVGGNNYFTSHTDTTAGIQSYSVTAGKLVSGGTEYILTLNSGFSLTTSNSFIVDGQARNYDPANGINSYDGGTNPPKSFSVSATDPESGSTVYTLNKASNFDGRWTIDSVQQPISPNTTDTITKVAPVGQWSIDVSRPQSGGSTYALVGGQSNLEIDLTIDGQTITETNRSVTFNDADPAPYRNWSATFAPSTFSFHVDPNDVLYSGTVFEQSGTAITKGADEDDALTEIANAIIGTHVDITWDGTISTNSTNNNREVEINFGTTENVALDISLGGSNTKNGIITDVEIASNLSSYTLVSPDGNSSLSFNQGVIDASISDRLTVMGEAVRQVDLSIESPKDFTALSDGNSLIFTAVSRGTSSGIWNFAWDHGTSSGNLRSKTYSTDSDATSSSGNANAEVTREGIAEGTVNNTSFPSGTYSSTYTNAVRDERNFFAERAVIYLEGDTEPSISTTTIDYTWREILSSG